MSKWKKCKKKNNFWPTLYQQTVNELYVGWRYRFRLIRGYSINLIVICEQINILLFLSNSIFGTLIKLKHIALSKYQILYKKFKMWITI